MNNTVTFPELLAGLPRGPFDGRQLHAFAVQENEPAFVPPTLRVVESPEAPMVTLISARGATGKSVLARELSARAKVPLWALDADVNVSADAFPTRLSTYMGGEALPELFEEDPDAFVVVDALDEARMRVSGSSWAEFVTSLARTAAKGHHLVLLGRERVLEDVWLDLADHDIQAAWFEISHFDASQRHAYVDGRVGPRGIDTANDAYIKARNAVLDALEGTVSGPLADAFVGYAPVLDAVVALLAEGNLIAVENAFSAGHEDGERVDVLFKVLGSLLDREQEKVRPLAEQLGLPPSDVYRADEQIAWLASELMQTEVPRLEWCPAPSRAEYASQIEAFLRDHPFRAEARWASPVFSAYVGTHRFGDPRIRESLRGIGEATGLLFEFVSHTGSASLIDEWQFAALHASALAAEWQEVEVVVSIEGPWPHGDSSTSPPDQCSGELVLLVDGEAHRRTVFDMVLDQPGTISLRGPTSFLSVVFPGTVAVTPSDASVVLGPECFIRGANLTMYGDTVQILRRAQSAQGSLSDEASVTLEVTGRFDCNAALSGSPEADTFELRVPADHLLVYPWVLYRRDLESPPTEPNDRAERFLKMLMSLVRRHGRRDMAVFDKKLEGRQSIKGDLFKAVLAKLEAMGVITVGGPMIFLNDPWTAERFDGKGRPGLTSLEDKRETWGPVLDGIAAVLP